MGKGSAPRKVRNDIEYANNWDRIFGARVKESVGSNTVSGVSIQTGNSRLDTENSLGSERCTEASTQVETDLHKPL